MDNLFKSFKDLDIRVGTVIHTELFNEAINPSYKITINFGDFGILKSSAQITQLYKVNELIDTQIIAIVNFPKKQIANFMSECLILGVVNDNGVGNCKGARDSDFNNFACYVIQPSNCNDLKNSSTNPGEKLSAEACSTGSLFFSASYTH